MVTSHTAPTDLLADAKWITTGLTTPPAGERPAYEFRRLFTLPDAAIRAGLTVTAHGVYEAFVNGERIGNEELTPGITSYRKSLQVQHYGLTTHLRAGENELLLVVSDGWFRGKTGAHRVPDSFGTELAVIASVDADTAKGVVRVGTDSSWECGVGVITRADLMDGQTTDLRRSGATVWQPAIPATGDLIRDRSRFTWPVAPPVRKTEAYPARRVTRLPSGRQIVDFGQNLNGWVRLTALGERDTTLTLTHGEALDDDGDLTLTHLDITIAPGMPSLPVGQVDIVISRGVPGDTFEPRHTTHGFRYVAIDGMEEDLAPEDITAFQVRTDLRHTGAFSSSNESLNALHQIAVASWRSNSLDIPTDCPQRERWGYTGDFQIFARSAAFLDDISGFGRKWLTSLADDQHEDGKISNVAPNCGIEPVPVIPISFDGSAGWGDAATIVPWELYRAYGDRAQLREHFPMMCRWVDYATSAAATGRHTSRIAANASPQEHERFIWDSGFHWGEWLEPDVAFNPQADPGIVATAYLAHSARITSEAARILGDVDAAQQYAHLADSVQWAWRTEFLVDGKLTVPTQANYVRALAFGLIPTHMIAQSAESLVRLIEENGTHLATGFLSTGMLLPVLADHGYADVAYSLLFQAGEPGWLVMLERGATTVWESWNGIDASGQPHESLNHYSKGAVITFLHEYIAGIRPAAPGYEEVEIHPHFDSRLQWAEGTLDTRHGLVRSRWEEDGEELIVSVAVPERMTARVKLFDGAVHDVVAGNHVWRVSRPPASTRIPFADRRGERVSTGSEDAHVKWNGRIDPMATTFGEILDADDSRALLEQFIPGVADSPMVEMARPLPLDTVLTMALANVDQESAHELRSRLAAL